MYPVPATGWNVTDGDYDYVYENDVFLPGHDYRCEVYVCTEDGYEYVMDLYTNPDTYPTVTVNGKTIIPSGQWDAVVVGSNTAWGYYTFRSGAAAPTQGIVVSGSIVSFGNGNDQVTLQLIKRGHSEPDYEITATGSFSFADVIPGVYTLRVSKVNHVTREYPVSVGNSSVIQDVKIHLIGDVTGDGRVNVGDVSALYTHIKGAKILY